jgi:hypothetical protein
VSFHWEKVSTDPLGLAGFALSLVFGAVTIVAKQKRPKYKWVLPVGFALAALSIAVGLRLAYLRQFAAPPPPQSPVAAPGPSMTINRVDQKVSNGNAVTGVQGEVTIAPPSQKTAKR